MSSRATSAARYIPSSRLISAWAKEYPATSASGWPRHNRSVSPA
jgi:hypothetical protein